MMLKLQGRIVLNGNSISLDMFNKTRQKSMIWTLSISVPDYGSWGYCQKVLPMQFREGQCSYFGKKGMTLHADVFLLQSTTGGNKQ